MKRIKPDPRPKVWKALRRQYWMSSKQVAQETGLPKAQVSSVLRRFWDDGKADRQTDVFGDLVYRKRSE